MAADKTCKFFDPSTDLANHAGLVSGDEYPYDTHLGYESCWSPARGAGVANWMMCECPNQPECDYYEPEVLTRTDFVRVYNTEDRYDYFVLGHQRIQRGVGQFKIYTWDADTPDAVQPPPTVAVAAHFNSIEHGLNVKITAKAAFEKLCRTRAGGDMTRVTHLPVIKGDNGTPKRSYLEMVTSA